MEKLLTVLALSAAVLVVPVALLYAVWVHATEMSATDTQGSTLTLTDAPCVIKELTQHLKPDWVAKFSAAFVAYKGTRYEACWILTQEGDVFVIDTGVQPGKPDTYSVPLMFFTPKPTI